MNELENWLLMPIEVNKLSGIHTKENDFTPIELEFFSDVSRQTKKWISGQKYFREADPDMSDLAIAFYEVIYRELLEKRENSPGKLIGDSRVLKESGELVDLRPGTPFAGDTMNSFNTLSGKLIKTLGDKNGTFIDQERMIPDDQAGRLRMILDSEAEPETKSLFIEFYYLYHSLANFWIIPMKYGRSSAKDYSGLNDTQDYMWKFLKAIKKDDKKWTDEPIYFQAIEDYENFLTIHYIREDDYLEGAQDVKGQRGKLTECEAVEIVKEMNQAIKNRAKSLSESRYAEDLWWLFNKLEKERS